MPSRPAPSRYARQALRIAATSAGLLVATYLLSAHTIAVSRFEQTVLQSSGGASPRWAAGLLDTITSWSVTPTVVGVWALGWRRGGPLLGGVAAGVILASIGTADLLQHVLPLACSGCTDRSFPSGHAAVGTSVMCTLLLIGPDRFRAGTALLASAVMSAIAALTVTAKWHRPSDTVGSALIVLIYAAAAAAFLARHDRIQAVRQNPIARTVAVTALRVQSAVAAGIACACVIINLTAPTGSRWATSAALTGGLAITVATGGLTALVMLTLLGNASVTQGHHQSRRSPPSAPPRWRAMSRPLPWKASAPSSTSPRTTPPPPAHHKPRLALKPHRLPIRSDHSRIFLSVLAISLTYLSRNAWSEVIGRRISMVRTDRK